MIFSACSSSEETAKDAPGKSIREHEGNFDPTEYRRKPAEPKENAGEGEIKAKPVEPAWVERTEKSMGFRVQLYSTTNIDDAKAVLEQMRSRIDSLHIEAGRLDMSFDAPYYKIRAGDFLVRAKADTLREQLRSAGLSEAWVVRDNVFRVIRERKK
ncbi:MAG: SPOR domain-containing protein [Bacteroidetes bacterium]|nr:SPOR domain-containing protein [Bacteroidota bacterium]